MGRHWASQGLQIRRNLLRLFHSNGLRMLLMAERAQFTVGKVRFGGGAPLFLIAGPCVIESEAHALMMAEKLGEIASDLGVPYIFKASYDKANRSSVTSYRGPGLKNGLRILAKIKKRTGLPILDRRARSFAGGAGSGGLRRAANSGVSFAPDGSARRRGQSGRVVNIKKGQFLSPWDIGNCRRKSGEHRKRKNHSDGAGSFVRLSESCRGHARRFPSCGSSAIRWFST